MKELTDIEITEGQGYKYLLKFTITEKGVGTTTAIRGNDIDMITDWAEWKITNDLCGFKHNKKNKMEDYEVVHGIQ